MNQVTEVAVMIHNIIVRERRLGHSSDESTGRRAVIDKTKFVYKILFTVRPSEALPLFERASVKASSAI